MKFNKVEIVAFIVLILVLIFVITGCSTVAGVGKDITSAAEWSKEKITEPKQEPKK